MMCNHCGMDRCESGVTVCESCISDGWCDDCGKNRQAGYASQCKYCFLK